MNYPILSEEAVQEYIDSGIAARYDFDDGYIVLQQQGTVLFLLMIKFKHLNYSSMLRVLKYIARNRGCTSISGMGRPGWYRTLLPFGFIKQPDGSMSLTLTKE